jgi:recombinational DNA repair protein (RecF pathway)
MLEVLGFAPELGVCVHSGKPVSGACRFSWEGGVCVEGPANTKLSALGLEAMRAMQETRASCPVSLSNAGTTEEVAKEIFYVLRNYVSHHVESAFRSVQVIEQMMKQ